MKRSELGLIHPLAVATAVLAVLVISLGGFSVWAYANYVDQKDNVDTKIAAAVKTGKQEQKDADDKAFVEQEKQPTREFVGPDDLGRLSFSYPKTWSVYVGKDGSNGTYEAYLHPGSVVNPENGRQAYAVHVLIDGTKYEDVLRQYQDSVSRGKLKAVPITVNNVTGVRLDGQMSETAQGSVIVFKVRDKTIRVSTEVSTSVADFNTIILPSLKFNS